MSTGLSGARHESKNVGQGRSLKFKIQGSEVEALAGAIGRVKAEFPEYAQYKTAANQPDFAIELVEHWRSKGRWHNFHYHGSWVLFVGF